MVSVAQPIPGAFAPSRPTVKIVPVKLLPVVAVVLVGLVTAIATNSRWALDFYHVAADCGPGSTCSWVSCWARSSARCRSRRGLSCPAG